MMTHDLKLYGGYQLGVLVGSIGGDRKKCTHVILATWAAKKAMNPKENISYSDTMVWGGRKLSEGQALICTEAHVI